MKPLAPVFILFLSMAGAGADEVTLTGGRILKGEVLAEDDRKVTLKAASGTLEIPRDQVVSVKRGRYLPPPRRVEVEEEARADSAPDPVKPPPSPPSGPDADEIRSRIRTALGAFGRAEQSETSDNAIASLVALGPPAVPFLSEALSGQAPAPSVHLIRALALIDGSEAAEALVAQLANPLGEARSAAALALGQRGAKDAVKPLAALLKDGDWTVRRDASQALGTLKAKAAVPELVDLMTDVNLYVRAQAQESLKVITEVDLGFEQGAWKTWVEANPDFFKEAR